MRREARGPYVIAGAYLIIGLAYIALSDYLAAAMTTTPEALSAVQTYKGWVFIAVTTVLLFIALRIYARRKNAVAAELQDSKEEIRESLRQKEALIQELHHRVKNNMQVIISMLRLAGMHSQDAMSRAVDRVYAMALVHEKIYRSESAAEVDARAYIEELANHIAAGRGREGITVEVAAAREPMHIDTAIPCGIVLNEALTNALQHAFPGDRTGTIHVAYETAGRWHRLSVSDNGSGYHVQTDVATMGLTLIRSMATQLEGDVKTSTGEGGTQVCVRFPARSGETLHQ